MLLLSIHHDARNNERAQPLVSLTLDGCAMPARTKVSPLEIRQVFASDNDSKARQRPSSASQGETSASSQQSSSSALPQHHLIELVGTIPHHPHHHRATSLSLSKTSDQAFTAKPISWQKSEGTKQSHVTFTKIHIREHSITVGDHDWCEGSLPIQLDWQHTPTHSMDVDDYEWHRQRQGRTPRGRLPKLDPSQRKRLLRKVAGITEEDLFLLERQHIDSQYVTQHCSKTKTFYAAQ